MTPIPPCPRCGYDEVYVCVQISGTTKAWFDKDGVYEEMDNDPMVMSHSRVVRCGRCKKKRPDLHREANRVLPNQSLQATGATGGTKLKRAKRTRA